MVDGIDEVARMTSSRPWALFAQPSSCEFDRSETLLETLKPSLIHPFDTGGVVA